MEVSRITYKQLITMPKMHIFWFMNQAHEPKWGNLRKCGLEGFQQRAPRLTLGLGWHNQL